MSIISDAYKDQVNQYLVFEIDEEEYGCSRLSACTMGRCSQVPRTALVQCKGAAHHYSWRRQVRLSASCLR